MLIQVSYPISTMSS